jgi:hypothetical protein
VRAGPHAASRVPIKSIKINLRIIIVLLKKVSFTWLRLYHKASKTQMSF